jgi:hypothetical protein
VPPRTIDGPGGGKFLSGEKAAEWLGVSEDTLERLAENCAVGGVVWMRPKKAGRKTLWDWEDVYVLAHLLGKVDGLAGRSAGEKKSE